MLIIKSLFENYIKYVFYSIKYKVKILSNIIPLYNIFDIICLEYLHLGLCRFNLGSSFRFLVL